MIQSEKVIVDLMKRVERGASLMECLRAAYMCGMQAQKEKDAAFILSHRETGKMKDTVQVFDVLAAAILK